MLEYSWFRWFVCARDDRGHGRFSSFILSLPFVHSFIRLICDRSHRRSINSYVNHKPDGQYNNKKNQRWTMHKKKWVKISFYFNAAKWNCATSSGQKGLRVGFLRGLLFLHKLFFSRPFFPRSHFYWILVLADLNHLGDNSMAVKLPIRILFIDFRKNKCSRKIERNTHLNWWWFAWKGVNWFRRHHKFWFLTDVQASMTVK